MCIQIVTRSGCVAALASGTWQSGRTHDTYTSTLTGHLFVVDSESGSRSRTVAVENDRHRRRSLPNVEQPYRAFTDFVLDSSDTAQNKLESRLQIVGQRQTDYGALGSSTRL